MFDLKGTERLIAWKSFRDSLESEKDPFQSVSDFWARAPFVNSFLHPDDSDTWPDPWHLILDNRYDELAIVLGMLYTLKLTDRFSDTNLEIYMTVKRDEKKSAVFFLVADNNVINLEYNRVVHISMLDNIETVKIYPAVPSK